MSSGPCATFRTRMTPKMRPRPSATIAYRAPARRPEMTTWPTMAGVMITGASAPRPARAAPAPRRAARGSGSDAPRPGLAAPLRAAEGRDAGRRHRRGRASASVPVAIALALAPGRRREARLGVAELLRPHDGALAVLPLEHHHLVRRLEAVGVHRVVAERRAHLQLQ